MKKVLTEEWKDYTQIEFTTLCDNELKLNIADNNSPLAYNMEHDAMLHIFHYKVKLDGTPYFHALWMIVGLAQLFHLFSLFHSSMFVVRMSEFYLSRYIRSNR